MLARWCRQVWMTAIYRVSKTRWENDLDRSFRAGRELAARNAQNRCEQEFRRGQLRVINHMHQMIVFQKGQEEADRWREICLDGMGLAEGGQ